MDQSTVIQLFENMKMLRDSEKYPKSMILNMDECWVSTENKQHHRNGIHTKETDSIHNQTADGKHVTLIDWISVDDEFVEPSYIIPYPLLNKKTIVWDKWRPLFNKVDIWEDLYSQDGLVKYSSPMSIRNELISNSMLSWYVMHIPHIWMKMSYHSFILITLIC